MWKKLIIDGEETLYSVSDDGQIRNDSRNKLLTLNDEQGYKTVGLHINKKLKKYRVHRLIAMMWIDNPDNKPYVNHKDGNRSNNRVENLEWVTPMENTQHAVNTGLLTSKRKRPVNQYDADGNFLAQYDSITEAALITNSDSAKITVCCQGGRLTTNGFQWRYSDSELPVTTVYPNPSKAVPVAQIDPNTNEILAIYPTIHAAAEAVHGTQSAITHVLKGDKQTKTHKGYCWKRVEEIVQ